MTLSEEELAEGVRLALRTTHNLAEGAGAAPLMAAMKLRDRLAGKKVVCVMSGGNIDRATLTKILGGRPEGRPLRTAAAVPLASRFRILVAAFGLPSGRP